MNGEVRAEIKRKWRVRQLSRNLSGHRSVRNGTSASFSGGGCNEIREPLRPAIRRLNSPNRTSSNVKDRFLALKKNAFGSNSVNGHVQLGNGSARQLLPRLSQTDTTDQEPSPRVVRKQETAEEEHHQDEIAETTPLKAACVEHNEEAFNDEDGDNPTAEVTKPKAAPLIRTMDELSRIHDSNSELHNDDVIRPLCSKEQQNVETDKLARSVPTKTLVDCAGASCSTADISTGDSPPSYKDLFPEIKQSSSMSNIETQV